MLKAYLRGWLQYLNTEKGRHDLTDRAKALLLIALISLLLALCLALWRGDLKL